jgi:CheY-like chemotaxis protein
MVHGERRILLVDDDTSNLEILGALLRSEGYVVVCARNGAEAMACLRNARPDIVMLDYVMPTMDGATMAGMLRDRDETKEIAIVMTSGLPEDMVRPRCTVYDAFLQKPFALEAALHTLATVTAPAALERS